jgi:hypothetical protein
MNEDILSVAITFLKGSALPLRKVVEKEKNPRQLSRILGRVNEGLEKNPTYNQMIRDQ